jgi:hypothetical protein
MICHICEKDHSDKENATLRAQVERAEAEVARLRALARKLAKAVDREPSQVEAAYLLVEARAAGLLEERGEGEK